MVFTLSGAVAGRFDAPGAFAERHGVHSRQRMVRDAVRAVKACEG